MQAQSVTNSSNKMHNLFKEEYFQSQHYQTSTNQSYQEYQLHSIREANKSFASMLHQLCNEGLKTKFLNNLIQNHTKYSSCLLAFCDQINDVLCQGSLFSLSHQNYASQSALLAFYLANSSRDKVNLIACEDSLLQVSHIIAGETEDDKISFTKNALKKQGVFIYDLKQWQKEGWSCEADSIVILDIFSINPVQYSPFLLLNYSNLMMAKKVFIYHSHLQNQEIQEFINLLSANPLQLQLWASHPIESMAQKNQQKVLEELVNFLKGDKYHPQKQDVVFFYPYDQNIKRFSVKLNQLFSQAGLGEFVSVITKPHQKQSRSKNNIFIVEGTERLQQWNYKYSNILYVIDYGKQKKLTFNYELCSYEQQIGCVSSFEKAKRYSLLGNNQFGIYVNLAEQQTINSCSYLDSVKDISFYLLKMIDYGLGHHLNQQNKRVFHGLKLLQKLAAKKQNELIILDESYIGYAKQGIPPLEYKFISSFANIKHSQKFLNLAIYMSILIHSRKNIKYKKQETSKLISSKSTQLWKKRDYIESCCLILAQSQTNQIHSSTQGQSLSFRKNSSRMEQNENDPFGSIYSVIDSTRNKKQGGIFSINAYLADNQIDEQVYYEVREQVDHYRQVLAIEKTSIIFEQQDFNVILQGYIHLLKESLLFYSGSILKGYRWQNIKQQTDHVHIDAQYLKKQYYLKPMLLAALRYQIKQGQREIIIWNKVPQKMYLQVQGALPIVEEASNQTEVQFHGISSLMFERLWRNSGLQMSTFEKDHNCFIEPNHQLAIIVIHCDKDEANLIKTQFEGILQKIKEHISASNRLAHYVGNVKLHLGAGGCVKELVVGDYINQALLSNLHIEITKNDLQELFQQFVAVKDISIQVPSVGKQTKSAIINFHFQKDYYRFYQIFDQCQLYGYKLQVTPIKPQQKIDFTSQKDYAEFKWFVWQTHRKALVRYKNEDGAKKAYQYFTSNPQLDGCRIQVSIDGKNIFMNSLCELTDQIFIEQALSKYGEIEQIQILKTPLRDAPTDSIQLQNLIFGCIKNKQFTLQKIEKGKDGLRKCKVRFSRHQNLMSAVSLLNKTVRANGKSRLYATSNFQRIIKFSGLIGSIVVEILQEAFDEFEGLNLIKPKMISYKRIDDMIILHSYDKTALQIIHSTIWRRIKGEIIRLTNKQKNLVFTEIGFANLLHLEEKYNCKLIINIATQTLSAICRKKVIQSIQKEIAMQLSNSFFYKIYLHSRAHRYFTSNPEVLLQIRQRYKLKLVELQVNQKSIILEGSIMNVQTAIIYFMYLIQSITNPEESRINSDICGICCQQPKKSYRLQLCLHRFCISCIQGYVKTVLTDISQFPFKCPHCSQLIIIQDLVVILDKNQWLKLQNFSINRYVDENSDKMAFCFTAGCRQINMFEDVLWKCQSCLAEYCNMCRQLSHKKLTCRQAMDFRQIDSLFIAYMQQNGVRVCPTPTCKMPIIKIDGCNSVFCTKCSKYMQYNTAELGSQHVIKIRDELAKKAK